MTYHHKASVIVFTAFASVGLLSAAAFLTSPTGAEAAWNCRTACTAAARGITSFSCPGTPTESICGASPNFTCYEGNNDPCPDNYRMYCELANCPVQCNRDNYPCGAPGGCNAATSNINAGCSDPAGGLYTDRCGTCVCPSGTVQCTSPNKCVTPTGCPTGYSFDPCLEACTTPNILISPTAPQAASISVTGDITTTAGNLIAQTGDLYLPSGKAIRIDAASNTLLNVGNGNNGWGYYDVNLNVLGSITATKSFGIGSVFSVNNLGQLSAATAVSGADAISGVNSHASSGTGVYGFGPNYGVRGVGGATGVYGYGTSQGVYGYGPVGLYGNGTGQGVVGTSTSGAGVQGQTSTNYGGYFTATGSGTGLFASSASGYAAIFNNGKVGIGTTTPNHLLELLVSDLTGSTPQLSLNSTVAGGQKTISFRQNNTEEAYIRKAAGGDFFINTNSGFNVFTNGTSKLVVASGGNVGINYPSPGYKLTVGGDLFVSGAAGFGGASVGGGPTIAAIPLATGGQAIYAQANIANTTAIIGRANLDNNVGVQGFSAGTGSKGILGTAGVVGAYGGYFENQYGGEALRVAAGSTVIAGDLSVPGGPAATITLGDSTSDSVIFNARPASSINPQSDNLYDLGLATLRWRDLYIGGTAKLSGFQLGAGTTAGYILTANASGVGTWQANAAVGGSGTLNYVPKFTPSGTVLGNSMIFDNGTNIGIGTTAPNSNVKVHIANGNLGLDGGYGIYSKESGGAMIAIMAMDGSTNQTTIRGYGGGWRVAGKTGLQLMYIDDAGQTIIGSGSPTAKLDVAGTAKMTGFQLTTGAASGYVLKSDASGVGTWQSSGISGTANYLAKFTGTGVTVGNSQIQDNGTNVGIKGAPDGTYELRVTTGDYSAWFGNSNSWLKIFTGGNSRLGFADGAAHEAGYFATTHNASSQNVLKMSACTDAGSCAGSLNAVETGRFGIGTDTPATALDVNGTIKMTGYQLTTGATSGYYLKSDASGNGTWAAVPTYVGGSGTSYYVPRFTGSTTLGDSMMRQDIYGTGFGIGGTDSTNPIWGEMDIFRSGSYARLYLSSDQSSTGNIPGIMMFAAKNSAGYKKEYSGISGYISDNTNASEDGDIRFHTVLNGTWNVRAWLTSDGRLALGGYNPTAEMLYVPGNVQIGANSSSVKYLAFGYAPTTGSTQVGSSKPADLRWDPASGKVSLYIDGTSRLVFATASPSERFSVTAAGDVSTNGSNRMTSSFLYANVGNATGGGIWISDDGSLIDNNDGWITFSGSTGFNMNSKTIANAVMGSQTWGGNITWNDTVNISVPGESSFDVASGANWGVWDSANGRYMIHAVGNGVVALQEAGGSLSIGTTSTSANRVTIYGSSTNSALRLWGTNTVYGARLNFGDGNYVYLEEPTDDTFHIYSAGKKYFDGGYLGVGMSDPSLPFHVLGRAGLGRDWNTGGSLTFYPSDGYAWFHIDNGYNNAYPARGQGYMRFSYGGNPGDNLLMMLYQNKVVEVYNTAYKPGGGSWAASSDRRVKKDITPFFSGLDTIRQLQPINYTYNGLAETVEGFKGIGFIAQDVKDIAPYMVTTRQMKLHPEDEELTDIYYLDPSALPFLNLNAIKELTALMERKLSLDDRGGAVIPGDLTAENNIWGSDSGWIACPADGSECACPDGSYVSSVRDQGRAIRCHKL